MLTEWKSLKIHVRTIFEQWKWVNATTSSQAASERNIQIYDIFWTTCGWWTKSCTTKDDDYPIVYRVLTIPGGAGFCPSTVWFNEWFTFFSVCWWIIAQDILRFYPTSWSYSYFSFHCLLVAFFPGLGFKHFVFIYCTHVQPQTGDDFH